LNLHRDRDRLLQLLILNEQTVGYEDK
jgi:hypothetical protein